MILSGMAYKAKPKLQKSLSILMTQIKIGLQLDFQTLGSLNPFFIPKCTTKMFMITSNRLP